MICLFGFWSEIRNDDFCKIQINKTKTEYKLFKHLRTSKMLFYIHL